MDHPKEFRIEVVLLEVSKENRGKNKEIENIAGCLIAFACQVSFKKNYGGFVSLIPKTQLITHYSKNYGFLKMGNQLYVNGKISKGIILKYLNDE